MDLVTAIKARKSIRAFQPQPVPRHVLEQILELAARSPSWRNTQPWEVAVVGGETMEQLKASLLEVATSGTPADPDIPYPSFADPYLARSRDLGYKLYEVLGIKREDSEARREWGLLGRKFFDAPNGLVFYLDGQLGPWSLFDLGLFCQSVMLAALAFDLGSCPLANVIAYPKVVRRVLAIPERKKIVCGMAIGYPDWRHRANKLESPREAVASFTQWYDVGTERV